MAFDIPDLPTDNLHKFKAFIGLLLAFGGLIYIYQTVFPLREKAIDLKTQVAILQARAKTLNSDSVNINAIKIRGELSKAELNMDRLFWLSILFMPLSLFGLYLARVGFKNWTENQELSDRILRQQIEKRSDV
jgi:hypothetical protein